MVFQSRPYVAEVRVCNLSLQRHENSTLAFRQQQKHLLGRRLRSKINFNVGGNGFVSRMQQPQQQEQQQQLHQQQPLPLVELSPFRKSVWRREKSLPDFYDRRQGLHSQQQQKDGEGKKQAAPQPVFRSLSNGKDKQNQHQLDLTPAELAARLSAAVHAPDGEFGVQGEELFAHTHNNPQNSSGGGSKSRCCTHPRAEFHHESTRLWRTQDLIPGFITRMERTKTSMLSFYRDNSNYGADVGFYLGDENGSSFVNHTNSSGDGSDFSSNGGSMKVKGGRMKQQVQRRPLLYLNPLDSYRQAHDPARDMMHPWSDFSYVHPHSKVATRNSFPLTSSRARELMLSGAGHATYPLRPVRHHNVKSHPQQRHSTDAFYAPSTCNSPHKFNSKLGAARNSLEVLSSLGAPTKLEKSLEAEYEMNLARFRRDRLMVQPLDLRSVPSQYVPATMNLTRGELCLQEAREANRARKRKNLLTPLGAASNTASSSQLLNTDRASLSSDGGDGDGAAALSLKKQYSFVDQAMHPLDSVLAEESESHVLTDDDLSSASAVNGVLLKTTTKSAPAGKMAKAADGELGKGEGGVMFATTNSCVGKIQNTDSHEELPTDRTVRILDSKQKLSHEKQIDIDLTLDDDGEVICVQDTTTPVSVGGSSTSRAKTNLEYLNKLRTKGVPRPLQPLPNASLERDVQSSLPLQDNDVTKEKGNKADILKDCDVSEENRTVHKDHEGLVKQTISQNSTKEQAKSTLTIDQGDKPLAAKPGSPTSEDNGSSPGAQITVTGEMPAADASIGTTPRDASISAVIQLRTGEDQTKDKDIVLNVNATDTQENNSARGNGAASEDEGFASPKDIVSPKEFEPQTTSLGAEVANTNGKHDTGVSVKVKDDTKGAPQVSDRSEPQSISAVGREGEATPSVAPFLSARGDTRDEAVSTTPFGTPFTRGDSATLGGTPLTNLDTSLEPFSENEGGHSTSADNGDSGISTTFLTTEDSRAEILEGVVFS